MVPISKEEALRLIEGSSKRSHSVLSARLMKALAKILQENEDEWELVGLLHDLDYDLIQGDMSRHGIMAAEMLKGKMTERSLYAIKSHDHRTGVKPINLLDVSLILADSIAVLMEDQAIKALVDGAAIDRALGEESKTKPWIKENIVKFCCQLDISVIQILQNL